MVGRNVYATNNLIIYCRLLDFHEELTELSIRFCCLVIDIGLPKLLNLLPAYTVLSVIFTGRPCLPGTRLVS